jgi:hypothetical protein
MTMFEVAQAAMQHLAGGAAGGGHQLAFLVQINGFTASGKGPGGHDTVDSTANDCNLHSTASVVPVSV